MKFLIPLAVLSFSVVTFAQSTHPCKMDAYFFSSTGTANVRQTPNGKIITTLRHEVPAGYVPGTPVELTNKVEIIGQSGEWFQINKVYSVVTEPNGEASPRTLPRFAKPALDLAFVHKSIVATKSIDSGLPLAVFVEPNNRDANVKSNMGLLARNAEIRFTGCSGAYAQVTASNGAIGYTPASNLNGEKTVVIPEVPVEPIDPNQGVQQLKAHKAKFAGELASEVIAPE